MAFRVTRVRVLYCRFDKLSDSENLFLFNAVRFCNFSYRARKLFVIACNNSTKEIQLRVDQLSHDFVVFQNRLASARTDLGGKACSGTRPALKPRAALGEIGNIALNKEPLKKVNGKSIVYTCHSSPIDAGIFALIRSDEVQWYLGG